MDIKKLAGVGLAKEDQQLYYIGLGGLVLLLCIIAMLPAGQVRIKEFFKTEDSGNDSGAGTVSESENKGIYHYGRSLVGLGEKGAYMQFDMSLEYDKAGMTKAAKKSRVETVDAGTFFESNRGKISDAIITEMSRINTADAGAIQDVQDLIMVKINDSLHTKDEVVSGVYFNSFLLVPPEEDEE